MRAFAKRIVWVMLALPACSPVYAQGTDCICGGYNSARAGPNSFVDGPDFARARSHLLDPAFFGANGVVSRPVLVGNGVQTFAGAGSTTVFITGRVATSSYTQSERASLTNAVIVGMNLVVTSDDVNNDISGLFGVTLDNAGAEMSTVTVADHLIFAGPFGRITQFRNPGEQGHFRGWPSNAQVLAASSAGATVLTIPRGSLASGSGAVLFISGLDNLSTARRTLGLNDSDPDITVTDALVMNIVAHLCNPSLPVTAPHLVFPQFANGQNNVSYLNVTNAEKTDSVNATIDLRDNSGSPNNVNIVGMGAVSNFQTGNMVPYHTSLYMTDGTGTLKSGWASVRGSAQLSGSIIFHAPGLGSVGVGPSEVAGGFVLPVEPMPVLNPATGRVEAKEVGTGLAVANLGAKESSVRLELWDEVTGLRGDGKVRVTLPARGHFASYLHQLFPNFDFRGFRGTLRVVSLEGLISATGLQLGLLAGEFTSLPIRAIYR